MWDYHDGMGWWMVIGSVWMIIFWILIIALVAWGIKSLSGNRGSNSGGIGMNDALGIAKARYARGEITREEFEQIKRDLS